jgi:hypothetical protein
MEGIDKPHTGKYKEITNYSNYDVSCTLTSLPVWDLENFKRLIFVKQSVRLISNHPVCRLFSEKKEESPFPGANKDTIDIFTAMRTLSLNSVISQQHKK